MEPKSQVRLVFSGSAPWTREESHLLSSLASVLVIRLREVLREDLGATYGVGVSGDDYDALVDYVTPERLQEAARRYLDTERYVLGVLFPDEVDDEDVGQ